MTIIVYCSCSGSSEKYARCLSESTGFRCYSIDEDYDRDENIIFFGWLGGSKLNGISSIDRDKLLAVVAVSLNDSPSFGWDTVKQKNSIDVPLFNLRGWIDRSKLSFMQKFMITIVSLVYKLKGLNDHTRPMYDAMMHGGSFYDESSLKPVIEFCKSI